MKDTLAIVAIIGWYLVCVLINLSFLGFIIYVACHFLAKFW